MFKQKPIRRRRNSKRKSKYCDICCKNYASPASLYSHKRTYHLDPRDIIDLLFTKDLNKLETSAVQIGKSIKVEDSKSFNDSIPYETCLTQDVASLEYFNCQPASCSPSEEKCNTSAPMEIYQCITGGYIVKKPIPENYEHSKVLESFEYSDKPVYCNLCEKMCNRLDHREIHQWLTGESLLKRVAMVDVKKEVMEVKEEVMEVKKEVVEVKKEVVEVKVEVKMQVTQEMEMMVEQ